MDKMHLFHEIEYAHIVVFYLGLGLIVQGLALAIVNKEVKSLWKFSTEQKLGDIEEHIVKVRDEAVCGPLRLEKGLTSVKVSAPAAPTAAPTRFPGGDKTIERAVSRSGLA